MPADSTSQQPCVHCGECTRVCPETLNPEALFFALVDDDWARVRSCRLDACTECNRCVEVCPSRIPLVDWFRWGKGELRQLAQTDAVRTRYLARKSRLACERRERAARRGVASGTSSQELATTAKTQTISRDEVLAAIARGRAKRRPPQ